MCMCVCVFMWKYIWRERGRDLDFFMLESAMVALTKGKTTIIDILSTSYFKTSRKVYCHESSRRVFLNILQYCENLRILQENIFVF